MNRAGVARSTVVFAALVVLVGGGLGLMLIGRAREAALRAECSFNMKHLGDGIFFFQGAEKNLQQAKLKPHPRKGLGALPASCIAPAYATWFVQIAPYLPNSGALEKWDMQLYYSAQPDDVRKTALPLWYCPARPRESVLSTQGDIGPNGKHVPGAVGDYACASGTGAPEHDWRSADANGAIIVGEVLEQKGERILRWRSRTDFESLERGQSDTILLGEKHVPYGKFGAAEFGDGSIYNGDNFASFARIGGPGHGIAAGPMAPFNTNFGSYHAGVCNFLMADNSVRLVQNNMSEEVLAKLIRRY